MPHPSAPRRAALAAATCLPLVLGCASSTPRTLDEAYAAAVDARLSGSFERRGEETEKRLRAGRDLVRARLEAGDVRSAEDYVRAAFVLVSSRDLDDLDLAHQVAWRADELGDPRGGPLAAEALDRALFLQGMPQRFGTQYVYEPVLGRIILWDVDPTTTDEERAEFGLPGRAELEAYANQLNEAREKP